MKKNKNQIISKCSFEIMKSKTQNDQWKTLSDIALAIVLMLSKAQESILRETIEEKIFSGRKEQLWEIVNKINRYL